jgi:hypothetical protein
MSENYFKELYAIDVSQKLEKKGGLSYLSWAWAWAELKKIHPEAISKVYENADGYNYHHDNKTAWVKTGVTVNGVEHIEYLPIMNHQNKSIPLANITSFDVNKSIQRSLTKAIGRHGLGLSLYAGEDLPEEHETINIQTKPVQDKEKMATLAAIMKKQRPDGTDYFTGSQREGYRKKIEAFGLEETLKQAEIALEEMEAAQ